MEKLVGNLIVFYSFLSRRHFFNNVPNKLFFSSFSCQKTSTNTYTDMSPLQSGIPDTYTDMSPLQAGIPDTYTDISPLQMGFLGSSWIYTGILGIQEIYANIKPLYSTYLMLNYMKIQQPAWWEVVNPSSANILNPVIRYYQYHFVSYSKLPQQVVCPLVVIS